MMADNLNHLYLIMFCFNFSSRLTFFVPKTRAGETFTTGEKNERHFRTKRGDLRILVMIIIIIFGVVSTHKVFNALP